MKKWPFYHRPKPVDNLALFTLLLSQLASFKTTWQEIFEEICLAHPVSLSTLFFVDDEMAASLPLTPK